MAVDFEAFAITTDERIVESTRAAGIKNPRRGVLGNRGEPYVPGELRPVPRQDDLILADNADAVLTFIHAFGVDALGFFAEWRSGASFCLTRWKWGKIDWIRRL